MSGKPATAGIAMPGSYTPRLSFGTFGRNPRLRRVAWRSSSDFTELPKWLTLSAEDASSERLGEAAAEAVRPLKCFSSIKCGYIPSLATSDIVHSFSSRLHPHLRSRKNSSSTPALALPSIQRTALQELPLPRPVLSFHKYHGSSTCAQLPSFLPLGSETLPPPTTLATVFQSSTFATYLQDKDYRLPAARLRKQIATIVCVVPKNLTQRNLRCWVTKLWEDNTPSLRSFPHSMVSLMEELRPGWKKSLSKRLSREGWKQLPLPISGFQGTRTGVKVNEIQFRCTRGVDNLALHVLLPMSSTRLPNARLPSNTLGLQWNRASNTFLLLLNV